jgi:hypothetical protein
MFANEYSVHHISATLYVSRFRRNEAHVVVANMADIWTVTTGREYRQTAKKVRQIQKLM